MRRLFVLALGLLVMSCQSEKSRDNVLKGTIDSVENGTAVYISEFTKGNQTKPIDTVEVQDGKFSVNLPKVDFQTLNVLHIKDIRGNVLFINENKSLTLTLDKDNMRASKVEGGPSNELFSDYMSYLDKNNRKLMDMADNYDKDELKKPEVKKELAAKRRAIQKQNTEYRKDAIKNHPNSLASIFIFTDMMRARDVSGAEMKKLYDGLSPDVKETYIGQQIGNQLAQDEAVAIGSKAPEFSAKTPEGEELALKDVLGKYTLIDFWASWCKPCRMENPNVVKVYEEYHDKGLNILGVSLDKNKSKWEKAIKDDGLLWKQISNLKFWNDPIAKKYNVRAIPSNFLLDENGKIVAKNLRGASLENKIEDLLGD